MAQEASMLTAAAVPEFVEDIVVAIVRNLYPSMHIGDVHEMAQQCKTVLIRGIEAANPKKNPTKSTTSFLSLSAELRNWIYELVLLPTKAGGRCKTAYQIGPRYSSIIACYRSDKQSLVDPTYFRYGAYMDYHILGKQPAITKVCRQLRQETLPIYYGANEFVIPAQVAWTQDAWMARVRVSYPLAKRWLRAIGPDNVRLLRHVTVLFGGYGHLKGNAAAMRFDIMMARAGIELPESCVKTYWQGHDRHRDDEHAANKWKVSPEQKEDFPEDEVDIGDVYHLLGS